MLEIPFRLTRAMQLACLLAFTALSGCSAEAGDDAELESVSQALCTVAQLTSGVTASASSVENAGTPASAAIDGNQATRWSSAFADPQWIRLDLGQSRYIDHVVLTWEAASAADYQLQISPDGNAWTTVKTVTNAANGARTDTLTGLSAHVGRYVRVNGTRRTTPYGYSLFEFKVYGDTNPGCASSTPVCGNGVVESGEACDDGNTVSTDACTNACRAPACSDAICSASESCSSCAADCGPCSTGRNIANNLEAEANDGMLGLQYEATTDTGGGQNAGWIDPNDYVQWSISVPTTGNYTLTARSATTAAASLQVLVDGALKTTLGLPSSGGWQAWQSVTTPSIALTAGTHTLRVLFTSASQNLNYVKVSPAGAVENKVTLTVTAPDQWLYVFVNGVRRKVYRAYQEDTNLDVTSWFANGANTVRLQSINTWQPQSFSVQLKVNGTTVINEVCDARVAPCGTLPPGFGILFDKTYTVNTAFGLARQNLTVTGGSGGKLYLNDQYTGLSVPATLSLPQGIYTVGVGVSTEPPLAHTGSFTERTVVVGGSAQTVNLGALAALAPTHHRVAILPVRTAIFGAGGPNGTGQLWNSDIAVMNTAALATRDEYLKPFSYGLATWDVTVLPTVEGTPLYIADPGQPPDTGRFYLESGLNDGPGALEANYDFVIFLYSIYKADGSGVTGSSCCFWGGGQAISYMNLFARAGNTGPDFYLLHESLHVYDSYQSWYTGKYTGAEGTHGSDEHGYTFGADSEPDFVAYYRDLERGQVAELNTMRIGTTFGGPRPTNPDLWVGNFDVMRRGLAMNPPSPSFASLASVRASAPKPELCGLRAPSVSKQ